jgi:hypothetical protein
VNISDKLHAKHTFSADTIARNPALFGRSIEGTGLGLPEPEKPRLKQKRSKVSELEKDFEGYLRVAILNTTSVYAQFPLRIGNGSNYYLDFLTVEAQNPSRISIIGYEVKGPYARSTGIVKLKAAASLYPWIKFYMVTRENEIWKYEAVLP